MTTPHTPQSNPELHVPNPQIPPARLGEAAVALAVDYSDLRTGLEIHQGVGEATDLYQDRALRDGRALGAILKQGERPEVQDSAKALIENGFVKPLPRFDQQLTDDSRTTPFYYRGYKKPAYGPMAEKEGLDGLASFLDAFTSLPIAEGHVDRQTMEELVQKAYGIKECLCFVGDNEFQEAARGTGDYWRAYLEDDPANQIYVVTDIAKLERYAKAEYKSDEHLRRTIMDGFSEAEQEKYRDRIVDSLDKLTSAPANVKIILLDDWTISGKQIESELEGLRNMPQMRPYIENRRLEVNLIAASPERIESGFLYDPKQTSLGSVGVKSYFSALKAPEGSAEHGVHLTGLHSSVNYDFAFPLKDMATAMTGVRRSTMVPALARVFQKYRMSPARRESLQIDPPRVPKQKERRRQP